jgi:hypothetical protein
MRISATEGQVVTVIMSSGGRVIGEFRREADLIMVDDWVIDPDKVVGWKPGAHPWKAYKAKKDL